MGRRRQALVGGLAALVVAAATFVVVRASGDGAAELAQVDVARESVAIDRGGTGHPVPAAQADADLEVGDRITTDAEGLGTVNWFDGSLSRLSGNADFTIQELGDEGSRQIVGHLDFGESWHRVKEASGSGARFEVHTDSAVAAVRGTSFLVRCIPTCRFGVAEGQLQIINIDGDEILLDEGEQLDVDDDGNFGEPEPLDPNDPWLQLNEELDAELDDGEGDGSDDEGDDDTSTTSPSTSTPPTSTPPSSEPEDNPFDGGTPTSRSPPTTSAPDAESDDADPPATTPPGTIPGDPPPTTPPPTTPPITVPPTTVPPTTEPPASTSTSTTPPSTSSSTTSSTTTSSSTTSTTASTTTSSTPTTTPPTTSPPTGGGGGGGTGTGTTTTTSTTSVATTSTTAVATGSVSGTVFEPDGSPFELEVAFLRVESDSGLALACPHDAGDDVVCPASDIQPDGTFTISGLSAGTWDVFAAPPESRPDLDLSPSELVDLAPGENATGVDLTFLEVLDEPPPPTGSVVGLVTDGASELEGAGIEVCPRNLDVACSTATTGGDGTFAIAGLPFGTYTLLVEPPTDRDDLSSVTVEFLLDSGHLDLGNIVLPTAEPTTKGTIEGTVTDEGGEPVPGATVLLRPNFDSPDVDTVTNESGHYAFMDVPLGSYDLSVIPPPSWGLHEGSAGGIEIDAVTAEWTEDFTLNYRPLGTITGFVVDNTGNPVGNAVVRAVGDTGYESSTLSFSSHPDGDGFFFFLDIPADTYSIAAEASAGSHGPSQTEIVVFDQVAIDGGVELTLVVESLDPPDSPAPPATGSISGSVTSGETPLPGAPIELCPSSGGGACLEQDTGSVGTYAFTGLEFGTYLVSASPPAGLGPLRTITNVPATINESVWAVDVDFDLNPEEPTGTMSASASRADTAAPLEKIVSVPEKAQPNRGARHFGEPPEVAPVRLPKHFGAADVPAADQPAEPSRQPRHFGTPEPDAAVSPPEEPAPPPPPRRPRHFGDPKPEGAITPTTEPPKSVPEPVSAEPL